MSQTPTTEEKGASDEEIPSDEQTATCGTSTDGASKRERLRKQAKEAVRHRRPTGTESSSTSAPMKRTTPESGQPSGGTNVGPACEGHSAHVVASRRLLRQQAAGAPRNDDSWMVAGSVLGGSRKCCC